VDEVENPLGMFFGENLIGGGSPTALTDVPPGRRPRPPDRTALPLFECAFREVDREPGGGETALCLLTEEVCPERWLKRMSDGTVVAVCHPWEWSHDPGLRSAIGLTGRR
jgi:hypothetical protein